MNFWINRITGSVQTTRPDFAVGEAPNQEICWPSQCLVTTRSIDRLHNPTRTVRSARSGIIDFSAFRSRTVNYSSISDSKSLSSHDTRTQRPIRSITNRWSFNKRFRFLKSVNDSEFMTQIEQNLNELFVISSMALTLFGVH